MKFQVLFSKYIFSMICVVILVLMIFSGYWAYNFLTSRIKLSKIENQSELSLPGFDLEGYEKLVKKGK